MSAQRKTSGAFILWLFLDSTFLNMCKEKTPTILVSKICTFAFYTTHTLYFFLHT